MKLITETIEEVKYLTESDAAGQKSLYITGPFLVADTQNKNGRIYETKILAKEVDRYVKEYVDKKRAFGELGHPESPTIGLDRVSHLITSLKQNGSIFEGKAKILDTPMGKIAKSLIEGGAVLGVSSRGMGSLVSRNGINYVQPDFYLATAADIVADPSAPGAFVEGIMEGKEWVWNNGLVKEAEINSMRNAIVTAKRKQIEEVTLRQFENFLSKL
ncbi:prohead core scaffolding protein and protease [uncultured Caudovirales phage]|uniref:Prohead core scaffolding protein and protease n=1 Tax=uncultured Caudovirales phage TaxID=2100421 RepID=A0A6J5KWK6_9CAUD|nr:prohead core scaffolding protein and protease [uncultured Caudovirales phage]